MVPAQSVLINFENNFVMNGERDGERESKGRWMEDVVDAKGWTERREGWEEGGGRENNFVPKFP